MSSRTPAYKSLTPNDSRAREIAGEASGDEGSSLVEEDPNMDAKHVWKTLKKRSCPIVSAIIFELFICYVYTKWSVEAETDDRLALHADLEDVGNDVQQLRYALWTILGCCLVIRMLCVLGWARNCGPDSVWAALFMFFSSLPFICYWIIYFTMQGQLQVRSVHHDVHSSYALAADNFTTVETCHQPYNLPECDMSILVNGVACCTHDIWTLEMAGGGKVPLFWWDETLSMHTWYSMVLKWLSILAMSWIWKDMPLLPASDTDTAFMNDVWVDLLDCGVFADYVMTPWIQYYHFHLFYNLNSNVMHTGVDGIPHSASRDTGRSCDAVTREATLLHESGMECVTFIQQALWLVWVFAFFSSIISPTLWTLFRFCDKDSKDDKDIEGLLGDFTTHIRLLDRNQAKDMVDNLIDSQVKAYEEADGDRADHSHPVLVAPEGAKLEDSSLFSDSIGDEMGDLAAAFGDHEDDRLDHKAGTATFNPDNPGFYDVIFDDDSKKKKVPVPISRLEPDTEDHQRMCGPNCCHGWFKASYLKAEDHPTQEFERRGKYYESIRSCFLIEIPFFIYRFHFVVLGGGSLMGTSTILLLKNLIFMILDFMHVLACGNTKATCLNFTPIDKFEKFIKGSKLNSIFVGPGGMFKLAADLTTKGIQEQGKEVKDRLNMHKAWLILEREKAQDDMRDPEKADQQAQFAQEVDEFTKAIADVDDKCKKLDAKLKAVHM